MAPGANASLPTPAAVGQDGSMLAGLALVKDARELRATGAPALDVLLWEGCDGRVRTAAGELAATGLARPAMFADHDPEDDWHALPREHVTEAWREAELSARVPESDADLAAAAVRLGVVAGAIGGVVTSSPHVLRAGLRFVGAPGTVSIGFFVAPQHGERRGELFLFADAGVVPNPTEDELLDIALESIATWERTCGRPARVAFLDVTTKAATPAAGARVAARVREARPDVVVDGELQADAAVHAPVAKLKDPMGIGGGGANVLLFPTLASANIAYKLVQRIGGALVFNVTQGFRAPFYDVSRGCDGQELLDAVLHCSATAAIRAAEGRV